MPLNVDKISTGSLSVNGTDITGNAPYKVYTALLTQSGGDNPQTQTSGVVQVGVSYIISLVLGAEPDWDFSNVGGPIAPDNFDFVATSSDVPNIYGSATLNYNTGAPVVTVLENTLGDIVWSRDGAGAGIYKGTLSNSFTSDKTILFATGNAGGDGWVFFIDTSGVPNYIHLIQYDSIGQLIDNCQCQIEIRVYN